MTPALEAQSLFKTYRRWWSGKTVPALQDVNLEVAPGSIFGLLGPNGAGKTTLIKLALTIAHPDRGQIQVLGRPVSDRSVFRKVGYLPENPRFPNHLNANQILRFYGSLSGMSLAALDTEVPRWLARVGLSEWGETRVGRFSKGMNERLGFAQAVIHDPELIFLDEPTDGLDPVGRREVRSICRELADRGKTIFINSHILAEIELICDRIALMKGGRIVDQGTVAELTQGRGGYELQVATEAGLESWFREHALDAVQNNGTFLVRVPNRAAANYLIDALRIRGVEIESLQAHRRSLESVVIEKMEE